MCGDDLSSWGKKLKSKFRDEISLVKQRIEHLRSCPDATSDELFNVERNKLTALLIQEEKFWKQRSKVHWLKDGDQNTRFFHSIATSRKKQNNIKKQVGNNGNEVSDLPDICGVASSYFSDLFEAHSSQPSIITSLISPQLNNGDNDVLLAPFILDEFRLAIMNMESNFAPGPDGFNLAFYKHFWRYFMLDALGWTMVIFIPPLMILILY